MPYKPEAKSPIQCSLLPAKGQNKRDSLHSTSKGSYGLTRSFANNTQVVGTSRLMTAPHVVPANLTPNPACSLKRESKKPALAKRAGGGEYRERIPEHLPAWGTVWSCDLLN